MTKSELIKALEPFDDNMEVFISERNTEFDYGLLNDVSLKKINFKEDPNSETLSVEECIVLEDI